MRHRTRRPRGRRPQGSRSGAVFVPDEPRTGGLALPLGELLFGFVPGHAVALLDLADELAATARDDVEVIVGEPAPLLLGLARGLLPVTLNEVPVQMDSFGEATRSRARSLARDASRGRGKDWGLPGLRSVRRRTERGVPARAQARRCATPLCAPADRRRERENLPSGHWSRSSSGRCGAVVRADRMRVF